MAYKHSVSALIVIYAQDTGWVLRLQRRDDPDFWQSVTGSLEDGETAALNAQREVKEEVIANRLKTDYIRCPDMWQRSIAGCYQNNVAWL